SFVPTLGHGGNIDFSQGATLVIDTTSGNGQGSGGNVTLAAFASNGGNGGKVLLGTNNIDTRALGFSQDTSVPHNGGNVTIFAGAAPTTKTTTITVGSIQTGGGHQLAVINGNKSSGLGGSVLISTEQPTSPLGSNLILFNTQGQITHGKVQGTGKINQNASIVISGDINTAGEAGLATDGFALGGTSAGAITVRAGANLTTKNLYAFGAGGAGVPRVNHGFSTNN